MRELWHEFRLAARTLVARWRTTLVVVGTLALGIGATTAIFSVTSAVLLQPLPYADADRLVRVVSVRGGEPGPLSLREVEDLRERLDVFRDIAVHGLGNGGYNLNAFVLVRSEVQPETLIRAAEEVALGIDPDQSIWQPATMARRVADSLWQARLTGALVGLFGLLAIVLAGVGLYGVLSYSVRRRRREIGIRMALGARASQVLAGVLAESARQVAAGAALGLAGAVALARLIRSLLYRTGTAEPEILIAVAVTLAAVALVAGWAPARRAVRVDPVAALREE